MVCVDRRTPPPLLERPSQFFQAHQTKTAGILSRQRAVGKLSVIWRSIILQSPFPGVGLTKYGSFSSVAQLTRTDESTFGIALISSWRRSLIMSGLFNRYQVPVVRVWAVVSVPCELRSELVDFGRKCLHDSPAAKKSKASALNAFVLGDHCPLSLSGCNTVWKTVGVIEFASSPRRAKIRSLQLYRQKVSQSVKSTRVFKLTYVLYLEYSG